MNGLEPAKRDGEVRAFWNEGPDFVFRVDLKGGAERYHFAMPIKDLKKYLDHLLETGRLF